LREARENGWRTVYSSQYTVRTERVNK